MSPPGGPELPLRACLLSGGASRRMGRDKALLPHPDGGSWLERTLRLLAALGLPITLCSRHPEHLQRAQRLGGSLPGPAAAGAMPAIETMAEPPPWEGPLLALGRLAQRHPRERLLLCPVDMPWLTASALQQFRQAADAAPGTLQVAHDGQRAQPLLMVLPLDPALRTDLQRQLASGERRLQRWLDRHPCVPLRLDPLALANVNRPQEWLPPPPPTPPPPPPLLA